MSLDRLLFAGTLTVVVSMLCFPQPAAGATYERTVQPPSCDASKPEVKVISQASDWDAINSSQYRIFCVHPGDYSNVSVELRADGTANQPRYLIYDASAGTDPITTHPVKMSASERATIEELTFDDANWWVVQGLVVDGGDRLSPSGSGVDFFNGASNNVLDRLLVQHGRGTLIQFEHGASDNTVQNTVIRQTQSDPARPSKDYHCIHIKGDSPGTVGNRLVRNEIYDCAGDGIHFSGCPYWLPNAHELSYDCDINDKANRFAGDTRGTIIYDNDIYFTTDIKNVCGGSCACIENGIDIKSTLGDTDRSTVTPDDWVRIEKNRIWNDCDGGRDGIIAHFANTDYVLLRHNIITNWKFGYRPTVKEDPFVDHHSVIGNVFADSQNMTGVSKIGRDIEFYKNTVVNISDNGRNLGGYGDSDHLDLQCNAFIDAGGWSINPSKVHSDWNTFYDSESFGSGANNQSFGSVADAHMEDLCFDRRIWTGPETHCIANAKPTMQSPHLGHCPSDLGTYADVGVHDQVDPDFFTWFHEADAPPPRPDDWKFSPVDHFGNFDNYQAIDRSRWTITSVDGDRRLHLHTSDHQPRDDKPGEVALVEGRTFGDFDLTVEVKTGEMLSSNDFADFVVVFGYQDADNYLMLLAHQRADITKFIRVEDSARQELATLDVSLVPDEQWHELRLVLRGEQMQVNWDGQSIWTGLLGDVGDGQVGLGSFDEEVYFDNLDVTAPADTPGEDTGFDTGADSGVDPGTGSGTDSGVDAGFGDVGSTTEPDADGDPADSSQPTDSVMHDEAGCGCTSGGGAAGGMPGAHLWFFVLGFGLLRIGSRGASRVANRR